MTVAPSGAPCRLKRADQQLLWDHRLHCWKHHPSSLPKVLASVPSWDWASMAHIHSLLHQWPRLPPVTALEMLDSKYWNISRTSVEHVDGLMFDVHCCSSTSCCLCVLQPFTC